MTWKKSEPAAVTFRKNLFQFGCVALPKIIAGASTLALNLILLRFVGPQSYGVYALCVATILVADAVLGSAIDFAVLRLAPTYQVSDLKRSVAVQQAALYSKLIGALIVGVLLAMLARPISQGVLHQPGTESLVYISGISVVTLLLLRSAQVHLQVESRFGLYGALDFLHAFIKFGGIILVLMFKGPELALLLAFFAIGPAVVFLLWAVTAGRPIWQSSFPRAAAFRELFAFLKWFLITFGLSNVLVRMDVFCLTRWSGIAEVGIFSAGQVFVLIPQLLGTYLGVVLVPRAMPKWEAGEFHPLFRRVQMASLVAVVIAYGAAFALLGKLGPLLLPPSFARSIHVILALLPAGLCGFLLLPLTVPFIMFIRPKFLFTMDCIAFLLLVPIYRYAILARGAMGAAYVTSAYACIKAAVAITLAWRWSHNRNPVRPEAMAAITTAGTAEILEGGSFA